MEAADRHVAAQDLVRRRIMADAQPLTIMVPLGGVGARFQREGYASPKPFVTALGKPMILWVLDSLVLSPADELVIVYNPEFIPTKFWGVVTASYPRLRLVELPGATRGAAETVMIGLRGLPRDVRSRPVMLVDGDTFYGEDIVSKYRAHCATSHGVFYFVDTQPKPIYSYITFEPSSSLITQVKEKVKISDYANSGCYCFMSGTELEAECQVGTPAAHLGCRPPRLHRTMRPRASVLPLLFHPRPVIFPARRSSTPAARSSRRTRSVSTTRPA